MSTDLFNNQANDYIYPSVPQCPGESDTNTFEFGNKEIIISSGNTELLSMDLSDISQVVTSWDQKTQYLQEGEIIFIPGLTKGISTRTQYWWIDGSVSYTRTQGSYLDPYYMSIDMSINYYYNFKYYEKDVFVTSDYTAGVDIASAINIALAANNINVTATWDASKFTFSGGYAGYSYNVTAIDVSVWVPDTSTVGNSITEDTSSAIPAFKYPNGAMLGYVLKVTYPSIAEDYESYIKINHVPDYLTYYEVSTGDTDAYVRYNKAVDVGLNGNSTATTLSAGDYLYYADTNSLWEKVGVFRSWIAAADPTDSNVENLITGFYLYNPQDFTVKVDYITIL